MMMTEVRFDGFEQMAFIVGTALSPVLFRCAGYEGAFRSELLLLDQC